MFSSFLLPNFSLIQLLCPINKWLLLIKLYRINSDVSQSCVPQKLVYVLFSPIKITNWKRKSIRDLTCQNIDCLSHKGFAVGRGKYFPKFYIISFLMNLSCLLDCVFLVSYFRCKEFELTAFRWKCGPWTTAPMIQYAQASQKIKKLQMVLNCDSEILAEKGRNYLW